MSACSCQPFSSSVQTPTHPPLLCSLQVFVNATLPTLISHHDVLRSPWAMFCFWFHAMALHFWWRVEGEEENCWVSSVMSAVRLRQCHLREAAPERARGFALARRAWTSVLILVLPAALPLPFEVLSILHHCTAFSFYPFRFTELQRMHIDAMSDRQMESKAKWAHDLSPSLTTAAPSATSSCCWIIK